MTEDLEQLKRILEGAILAAGEPLSMHKLQTLFEEDAIPDKEVIEQALSQIKESCADHGFDLVEVASGWRFQVREDIAPWVNRLWEEKPQKYSRALLETLALIAYRQPLTRGDIEEVRGVTVSSHIIKTLTERDWVKVVGHRDVPGRPALYATTRIFLDYFGLKSLDELPTLGELKDIESLNRDLGLELTEMEVMAATLAEAKAAEVAPDAANGDDASDEPLATSDAGDRAAKELATGDEASGSRADLFAAEEENSGSNENDETPLPQPTSADDENTVAEDGRAPLKSSEQTQAFDEESEVSEDQHSEREQLNPPALSEEPRND